MIIAIDGPAASGKGTLGKRLAAHFGYHHLDTGLLYRGVASALLDEAGMVDDAEAGTGPVWAVDGDPRRTALGALKEPNGLLIGGIAAGIAGVMADLLSPLYATSFHRGFGLSNTQAGLLVTAALGTMAVVEFGLAHSIARRSLKLVATWGIVIASVVNMFLRSDGVSYLISFVGVGVFVGLTAYDTQKIKRLNESVDAGSEAGKKMAVMGALALYLDFINLFLFMLRFLGVRGRED
jgi:FtsH-binding integral membrane protein